LHKSDKKGTEPKENCYPYRYYQGPKFAMTGIEFVAQFAILRSGLGGLCSRLPAQLLNGRLQIL